MTHVILQPPNAFKADSCFHVTLMKMQFYCGIKLFLYCICIYSMSFSVLYSDALTVPTFKMFKGNHIHVLLISF